MLKQWTDKARTMWNELDSKQKKAIMMAAPVIISIVVKKVRKQKPEQQQYALCERGPYDYENTK